MRRGKVTSALALCGLLVQLLIGAVGCTAIAESPGQIELSTPEFDFGAVPNNKAVSQVLQVRNAGRGTLTILGLSTSCGCTTAEIQDRRLAPGASTDLTVTYDPLAHNGATGEFMRIVYIRSDDPDAAETTLTIRVQVVDSNKESN